MMFIVVVLGLCYDDSSYEFNSNSLAIHFDFHIHIDTHNHIINYCLMPPRWLPPELKVNCHGPLAGE